MMRNLYRKLSLTICFLLTIASVMAQERTVSGTVTDETGSAMPGVNILLKGTSSGTVTDGDGNFRISVPNDQAVLVISFVGYATSEVQVGSRAVVNIQLSADVQTLNELIVTGYTVQKRADIIGSVSVINSKNTVAQPAANISSMLQGRAAGITVSGTGAPGAGAKVRIRGFVSFGNNDPLYVIDGVQTDNASSLNPQDIESVQVLKDPVSASIYGSRAANGVIVITTKSGSSGKHEISYDAYYGSQAIPDRAYPKMLNTAQYADMLWRSFAGAGIANNHQIFGTGATPNIPAQLWTSMDNRPGPSFNGPANPGNYEVFQDLNPDLYGPYQVYNTPVGTDWHREATQSAPMQSHQISATGGGEKARYSLGFNYFDQQGVFKHTDFNRYSVRANTQFTPNKWLTIGQNMQISYTKQLGGGGNPQDLGGGLDFSGEGSAWAQSYRMVPYIPVYDINGNFGGNGIGNSGNGTNPVAALWRGRNNQFAGFNILGNVYARIKFLNDFTFGSSFGVDQRVGNGSSFTYITYERAENQKTNNFNEFFFRGGSWVWTNSLQYGKVFAEKHDVKVFAAMESVLEQFRSLSASRQDYDFSDPDFVSINTGKNLPLNGGAPSTPRALYSVFGKAEYQYNDRYLLSVTLRRDAASVFGPENRTAVFPAVGFGWRISEEAFMSNTTFISDLKLRGGWGQMGSQRNVSPTNAFSFFQAGLTSTGYDITGNNGGVVIGYRPDVVGNPGTKWESAEMINIGLDGSVLDGKLDFTIEYFNNTTRDLLVSRQRNGLAPVVNQPMINVGTMINKGIDGTIATRGKIGGSGLTYDVALTYTSFTNTAEKLDADGVAFFEQGAGRLSPIQRTQAGQSLSTFWGYKIDGIFQTQSEVDNHADMQYKRVGSWKIRDVNGDGVIDNQDQTFLGSPIPKFQLGTDLVLKYKGFDFNAFLYWNYGNKIYNYTKWWTDLRGFVGGVSERALTDSWSAENTNAKLPILNANDTYSGSISTDYYIEPGSYLRLRQLQVGYTFPSQVLSKVGLGRARIYVQGQNIFTVTKYSGPDPDINIQGGELQMGVDQFRTPSPTVYIIGASIGF
ncbi:MAG: TonB-dependent receptor [Cyclobacteriaceae bacterium]|nr:TonB-dependent receptor [Cyclobacteriaceae bacterium]